MLYTEGLPYDPSDVWSVGIFVCSQYGCETKCNRVRTGVPASSRCYTEMLLVDDCLTGADDPHSALILQQQLADLFTRGGFLLRKWNSSDPSVLEKIPQELRDTNRTQTISEVNEYTKTLGIDWNISTDGFRLTIAEFSPDTTITKRRMVSDVAKVFDVMGWFSPAIIKMKILLQRLWEKLDWDDPIPEHIYQDWFQWRSELPLLMTVRIPRCYSPSKETIVSTQLHGFSDASEEAYAGVVYLRIEYSTKRVHTSLVISKTKVSPIKRLIIPRLELCGAQTLTRLLQRTMKILKIPVKSVFAWTDSTVVLGWLSGNPRRLRHSLAIECPSSSINYLRKDGGTFLVQRIQQIVRRGFFFHPN